MPSEKKQLTIGILFGGQSVEHDISIISAGAVADALTQAGHKCVPIFIDKKGSWKCVNSIKKKPDVTGSAMLVPGAKGGIFFSKSVSGALTDPQKQKIDAVFPVLHGVRGEDGMIQSVLEACYIPYVGAGITGSAITNDKDITKRLLLQAGLPTASYIVMQKEKSVNYMDALRELGAPIWVKPANLGSSLGIQCVENKKEFNAAVAHAFSLDEKVLLEQHINARELECALLEINGELILSKPGEVIVESKYKFYDFDAKYNDSSSVRLRAPTDVSEAVLTRINELAPEVFRLLEGRHIMRIDLFLDERSHLYINEVQTIPGFTSISMYPKLLAHEGISLPELTDRLVRDALAKKWRRE